MRIKIFYNFSATLCLSVLLFSCSKDDNYLPQPSVKTNKFDASIASNWMELTRQLVKRETKNPPQASRIYAYAGVTLYESVVGGMAGNLSFSGQLNGLTEVPVYTKAVDYPTVANEALYNVENIIFGTLKPSSQQSLDSIHTIVLSQRKLLISTSMVENSIEYGKQLATVLLKWVAEDNFKETRSMVYLVPSAVGNPQFWKPTDLININPAEPFWGMVRCFSMTSSDMCEAPSVIPFSTVIGSPFYNQALEVLTINQNLTQPQKDIAKWWADGPGATPTPPGHWISIENQMAYELNMDLASAAEMYAMVGIAEADAFISCWYSKYKYNLLRPKTYIQDFITGNSSWTSFIPTPGFPEYPSGHSVSSGAASEVLTELLGTISFTDRTNSNLGLPPRFFTSFNEAASEAAVSRLYGGIHYREANETGIKQGRAIAQFLMRRVKLKR